MRRVLGGQRCAEPMLTGFPWTVGAMKISRIQAAMPPLCLLLTGEELAKDRKLLNSAKILCACGHQLPPLHTWCYQGPHNQAAMPSPCLIPTGAELPWSRKNPEPYLLCSWPLAPLHPRHHWEPLQSKQLHHPTPGLHWGTPKSSRAASGANSCGQHICRGEDKITVEPQRQGG